MRQVHIGGRGQLAALILHEETAGMENIVDTAKSVALEKLFKPVLRFRSINVVSKPPRPGQLGNMRTDAAQFIRVNVKHGRLFSSFDRPKNSACDFQGVEAEIASSERRDASPRDLDDAGRALHQTVG